MDRNKKKSKNIIVKIVALLCSFGLWLYIYNVENQTIENKISGVQVKINNVDALENSKLTLVPGQEFKINITVEGSATDAYFIKPEQFKLAVDLSPYALKKGENYVPVEVIDTPRNINIKKPENLRVKIELDDLVQKSIPVVEDIKKPNSSGVTLGKAILKPTEVMVSGPAQYVNTVKTVVAKGEVKYIDSDISLTKLPLVALDEAGGNVKEVKINPLTADVVIPVRKSKTAKINIKSKGSINKNLLLKSIEAVPEKVEITGPDVDIKDVGVIDTEPIDLSLITSSKEIAVKLILPKNVIILNNNNGMINVKVNIESINQKEVTVPITNMIGLGADLKAALANDKIVVTVQGNKDIIDAVKAEDITCEVDFTNLGIGEQMVTPKITIKNGASIISSNPDKIKVTISKK